MSREKNFFKDTDQQIWSKNGGLNKTGCIFKPELNCHILIVWFAIYCGGARRQNYRSPIFVPNITEGAVPLLPSPGKSDQPTNYCDFLNFLFELNQFNNLDIWIFVLWPWTLHRYRCSTAHEYKYVCDAIKYVDIGQDDLQKFKFILMPTWASKWGRNVI